jgi:effector-binding domain-containing protein
MRYQVRILETGPQLLASARGHGKKHDFVKRLFALLDEVWKFLKANPQVKHLGINVFLYHGEADKNLFHTDQGLPVEAGVRVGAAFASAGNVVCSATPGGTVATTVHIGPYEKLGEAHAAIRDWCQANNRRLAGPNWELYDHWNEDPGKLRTDVFYLLK